MKSGKGVLEQAIASYRQMPFETKELYKKYNINLQLPREATRGDVDGELEPLKKQIVEESRLRFDLTNDKNGFSSKSEFVRVTKTEKNEYRENQDETPEERLGNYVASSSDSAIEVQVPGGARAKLNFLFLCDGADMPTQILVDVGKGARLDLFEWFGSTQSCVSTAAPFHVINIADDAKAELNILHNENTSTSVGVLNRATVGEGAALRLNGIYNGGRLTKSATFAEAAGRGSDVLVNEIILGHAEQKFDIGTFMLNSNQLTRAVLRSGAVLKGRSFCILKGYAKVERNTRGSYSNVEEKGLVMDPEARIQPLPDMSIDCNNVAFASHSAATAPVDREALFYLMSRGVDENKAKRIFVASFISKYLADIENDIVKEIAISILLDKLDNDRLSQVPRISMQNLWMVPKKR